MSDSTGANDIGIQNVSPDSLQVNVNGEIKEIKNHRLCLLFEMYLKEYRTI